jgi:hypothetical protein
VDNFRSRHGGADLSVRDGGLHGEAPDGSWFTARLPFATDYAGAATAEAFAARVLPPEVWGVLLVRKGGFAVARLHRDEVVASKVGQRHVQGRTKAGGQSQQRFARRRGKQAREAFEAASDHAVRVLGDATTLVAGGDRAAVAEVLADARLARSHVVEPWLAVPDPRRAVLDAAIVDAQGIQVRVENTD